MHMEGSTPWLELLLGISGAFRPKVLTCLMGVTGAGKTTLMDVLAGRKTGEPLDVCSDCKRVQWCVRPGLTTRGGGGSLLGVLLGPGKTTLADAPAGRMCGQELNNNKPGVYGCDGWQKDWYGLSRRLCCGVILLLLILALSSWQVAMSSAYCKRSRLAAVWLDMLAGRKAGARGRAFD